MMIMIITITIHYPAKAKSQQCPSCVAKEGEYRKNESSGVHFHNALNNTTEYNTRLTITSATRGDQISPMSPLTRMALGPL